ncbi:MAG: HEAT repeat domain-containing protein [Terracidiphilus sp.]
MNCQIAQERIVTAEYGELADAEAREMERHLEGCPECRKEQEQQRALRVLADAYPVTEPDANLIARSRLRLEEALDALPPRRWFELLSQRVLHGFASLQAAPVAAGLLLALGVGAGSLGGFRLAESRAATAAPAHTAQTVPSQPAALDRIPAATEIASISSIVRRSDSHMVEVSYNQIVPQKTTGSLDDPAIRQLLMLASRNSSPAGVRDDSVGLMADECKAGHGCKTAGIRDALLVALRTDKSDTVREKALEGLKPYVAEDTRVRNAVLKVLLNDYDPKIRTAAISILEPVEGDTSVRQVLHSVADSDRNPYIRTVSRQVLENEPEIQ